jgi:pimeloyl-ACP methyl ester carboxylesterase
VPTIDVRAGQLHYLDEGEGPTLILLHGMGGEAALWSDVIVGLGGRFRTIGLDLRGHGQSASEAPISIEAIVDDLGEAIKKLGVSSFHLAGVSLGAAAALRLTASTPQQVQSLVICGIGVTLGNPLGNGLADEVYAIRETVVYLPSKRFSEQIAENILMPDTSPARIEALAAAVYKVTKKRYFETVQAFAACDNAAVARRVKCRTLILRGEADELASAPAADALSKLIAGSIRKDIADAGHHANIDNPKAFAAELGGFIKS